MGKFLKPGKVVICTSGKHAGKKAVIVKVLQKFLLSALTSYFVSFMHYIVEDTNNLF